MRSSIEVDAELEKDIARVSSLTKEKKATVMRLALRAGLPLVANRFQVPRPAGYFAQDYEKRDPERVRLEAAYAKGLRQRPER